MTSAPLLLAGPLSRPLEKEAYAEASRLLCRSAPHPHDQREGCHDCRRVADREHPDLAETGHQIHPAGRFILTATRPRLLPETILSRVVVRTLREMSRPETVQALRRRGLSAEDAAARAAFVPGDPDSAAALDLEAARHERDALLEALSGLLIDGSAAWGVILASHIAGDDATEAASRLGLLARLLRDAAVATVDPAGEGVVHRERFDDLERLGHRSRLDLLELASRALDLASNLPESRRNPKLATEAFVYSLVAPERAMVTGGTR